MVDDVDAEACVWFDGDGPWPWPDPAAFEAIARALCEIDEEREAGWVDC